MDEETPPVPVASGWEVLHLPWKLVGKLPWLEEGSFPSALAGAALLIITVAGSLTLVTYTAHRIRASRRRKRAREAREATLRTYDDLPDEVLQRVSTRQGVLHARRNLLATFTREWDSLQDVLPEILDRTLVDETRERLESAWSPSRRRQFYLRYHFPLTTVMDPLRWENLFAHSEGMHISGAAPVVRGVGESNEGMYIVVATAPGWTRSEWDDILPDIRVELDAPEAVVEIVNSSEVIIVLRDRNLRDPYVPVWESADTEEDDTTGTKQR